MYKPGEIQYKPGWACIEFRLKGGGISVFKYIKRGGYSLNFAIMNGFAIMKLFFDIYNKILSQKQFF